MAYLEVYYVWVLSAVRSFFYMLFVKVKMAIKLVFKGSFLNIYSCRNRMNSLNMSRSVAPRRVQEGALSWWSSDFQVLGLSKSSSVLFLRYVASWIDRRQHQSEKANLTILFDKYVPACLDKLRTSFRTITSIPENSLVQVCLLLHWGTFWSWYWTRYWTWYWGWSRQQEILLEQEDGEISGVEVSPTLILQPPCSPVTFENPCHIPVTFCYRSGL